MNKHPVTVKIAKKQLRKELSLLQNNYQELYEHTMELEEEVRRIRLENRYQMDFISENSLSDSYYYFRRNAREKTDDDLPFSYFSLK